MEGRIVIIILKFNSGEGDKFGMKLKYGVVLYYR